MTGPKQSPDLPLAHAASRGTMDVDKLKAMYILKYLDDVWLCDKCYTDESIALAVQANLDGENEIDPLVYTDVDLSEYIHKGEEEEST